MKAIKQIKITKFTLGNIKKLECVENIKTVNGKVTVYLKKDMTNGRLEATEQPKHPKTEPPEPREPMRI